MSYKTKRQTTTIIFIIAILLTLACNALSGVSPSINTATNTPTLESTSTSVPFKPGDPTATPLGSEISDPNYIKGV